MASQLSGPILIVEDDADIRESLEGFLELQGYEVVAVTHGRDALDHLQRGLRPAIVLLDMAMPVMDGHRLLTFRKENPGLQEVPVV
ncbi:MAG TPA: response regulator, partial [Myxococcaceae bacterium]